VAVQTSQSNSSILKQVNMVFILKSHTLVVGQSGECKEAFVIHDVIPVTFDSLFFQVKPQGMSDLRDSLSQHYKCELPLITETNVVEDGCGNPCTVSWR
jgi:hypothetical protein